MVVVVDLDRRVDTQQQRHRFCVVPSLRWIVSVTSICGSIRASTPVMSNVSSPVIPSDATLSVPLNWQRQHAHADKVRAVDALEALRDHRLHAEELRALRGPVARRAGAVFLAAEDDGRRASARCTSSRRRRSASARCRGWNSVTPPSTRVPSALRRQHQVLDAHVGERAAHHHLVVAAARAVAVEVDDRDVVLEQVDCRPARSA